MSAAVRGLYRPTPVSEQNYTSFSKIQSKKSTNLSDVPNASPVTSQSSLTGKKTHIIIFSIAGLLICAAIAIPLGVVLSSTVAPKSITQVTTTTATTSTSVTTTTTTTTTTSITAALTMSGPQLNFDPTTLTAAWSLCYSSTYATPMYPNISSILSTCSKNKLLLGCRPVGNSILTLAAMGNRADVLYNTAASSTTLWLANGVNWYYTTGTVNWNSWGFVHSSSSSSRGNCDGDTSCLSAYRLCWHMVGTAGGYRCGNNVNLDSSSSWQRVIYHAN